jgi:hypothetical protein
MAPRFREAIAPAQGSRRMILLQVEIELFREVGDLFA